MESNPVVPVSGVSEITLEQGDLAAAEKFYSEVLGFPVVERWADETVWVMAGDRTRIGLWRPQIGLGGGRGGVHVERLRQHGYTVLDHDHGGYGRHGRGRAAYVTDPGGHVVEFWTWDVAEHLRELAAGESPGSR